MSLATIDEKVFNPKYIASPTISRFHHSNAFVRGLMGNVGSGKSVACCMEMMIKAKQQEPGIDGVRRTRWAVVRSTYPELKTTTIPTWLNWFGAGTKMRWDSPITGIFTTGLPDGTRVEMEIHFLALDQEKDKSKLLSLELTGAFINETREVLWSLVTEVPSRVGRYPNDPIKGVCSWSGVIMDTNPPDDDSEWYRTFEEECPSNWELFRQPGALIPIEKDNGRYYEYERNPLAENVEHLPLGYAYWEQMIGLTRPGTEEERDLTPQELSKRRKDPNIKGQVGHNYIKPLEWIKVMVCGDYGFCMDGRPVYKGIWEDRVHLSKQPLAPIKGTPIRLGWDFGLSPACVIAQLTASGQLMVLREITSDDLPLKQFIDRHIKPVLQNEFMNHSVISVCDPAGNQRAQTDGVTLISILNEAGIPTHPAPTQDFSIRKGAVAEFLNRRFGDKPGMILDPSCTMLRKGFNGGYHYNRVQVGGKSTRYHDKPNKNEFSHIHDALQYLCCHADQRRKKYGVVQLARQQPSWGM